MVNTVRRLTLGAALAIFVTACGGGGSSLPRVSPTAGASSHANQPVVISIAVPAASSVGAAARRRPRYVSSNTQSATIAVNGGTPVTVNLSTTSSSCTATTGGGRTCTISLSAPVGSDTFVETLYASTDGTGSPLSQGQTTATIVAGQANTVALTLDGVIAKLGLALANAAPPQGTSVQIGLTVNFYDASGAGIIGSDSFVTPVTLTDSDSSGATSLSKATLNSPADAASLTLNYTGAALTQAVIGASAGSIAAPSVTLTPQASATVGFNDYVTFGYDNAHDVYNPNTTSITPASISKLHLAWQVALGGGDYNTQTQPILATEIAGHTGVLFVGGASGNVYAYDATSGTLLWTRNLGQEYYSCGYGQAYFGIGGTVAYDPSSKSLYVMGNNNQSTNATAQNILYHLDGATGQILGQVNIAPSPVSAHDLNFSHVSVTLNNGVAYVATSSTCDIASWRGRVVTVNVPAMTLTNTFFTIWDPNNTRGQGAQPYGGAGIWGWGGVTIDSGGNVLTGVGNADDGLSNGTIEAPFVKAPTEDVGYAETLLELDPTITNVVASNHPIAQSVFNSTTDANDLDVQGTPVVFTPNGTGCGTMVAIHDKFELSLYTENGLSNGPVAQYQMGPAVWHSSFLGGPAYSPATGLLYAYVATSEAPTLFSPGLVAINPGCGTPSVAWRAPFGADSSSSSIPRSVPAVSAGGVVFAGTVAGSGGAVWAVDASSGNVLNNTTPILSTSGHLRMPATIDGKWVFVIDNSGNMYGMTIDPSYATISAKRRANDSRQREGWGSAMRRP